jgi:hypothetical protein
MKSSWLRSVASLSLTMLVGCGGGSQMGGGNNGGSSGQNPPPGTSFAESWHFAPASSSPSIEAALILSSTSVAGVAHFQSFSTSSPCPAFFDKFPLSGTIDGQGNLSVKSSPVSGLVLFLTGVLAADRASVSSGSYHFTGGCLAGEIGTLSGVKVKPVTGSYTGTMQGAGHTVDISTQLTQAFTSDKDGFFPLAGTFTVANMCDETFTLNGASVVGNVVHLYSNTGTGLEGLTGVMDSEAQQIELDDYLFLGDCIAGAHGVVTRQ